MTAPELTARVAGLITFGSGLRKLDELRQLLGPGESLRVSGLVTLVGLAVFALGGLGSLLVLITPAGTASLLLTLLVAAFGASVAVAGLRDFMASRPSGELTWWIERLRGSGLRWWDLVASADPVSNGPLIPQSPDRVQPRLVGARPLDLLG